MVGAGGWLCAELLYDAIAALPGYFIDQPRRLGRQEGPNLDRYQLLVKIQAAQPSQDNFKVTDFIYRQFFVSAGAISEF